MKNPVAPGKAQDSFSGFPVVLCSMSGPKDNIITLAMCHIFSFEPPLVAIGIGPKRHSYGLLRASDDFAINIPTKGLLKAVEICGSKSGRKVDKFDAAGLTREKAEKILSPLIAECPVNIECVKVNEVDVGDHALFIGEVVAARKDTQYDSKDALLYWGEYRVIGDLVR